MQRSGDAASAAQAGDAAKCDCDASDTTVAGGSAPPREAPETEAATAVEGATTTSAADGTAHMFVFTAQKAGMQDVDKQHVQQVVYEMSKDSLFFQNSLRQNDRVDARIAEMRDKLAALTPARRESLRRQIDPLVARLEAARDLSRTMVVVDMDMFFAAVEMRDRPELRDKPLAVGGMGMLSTTNYVARKFGVRAAMPGFIGKELCPELVIVPPHYDKYTAISREIRAVVAAYDPHHRAMSLDEVYCDLTDFMEQHWTRYARTSGAVGTEDDGGRTGVGRQRPLDGGVRSRGDASASDDDDGDGEQDEGSLDDPVGATIFGGHDDGDEVIRRASRVPDAQREAIAGAIVDEMRRKIFEATGLTASAGIAANTMLAKICSDVNKPNGQCVLPFSRESVVTFVQQLPVRKIGGIGKVMEKVLGGALGIDTALALYNARVELFHVFTERTASWLLRKSLGLNESSSDAAPAPRKGYSRERTFGKISDPRWLEKICRELCDRLAADLARGPHGAKTITLKLKCVDFTVRTRAVTSACTLSSGDELFARAVELLRKEMPLSLRLLGVRASALVSLGGDAANATATGTARSTTTQVGMDKFTTTTHTPDCGDDGALDPFEALELRLLVEESERQRERARHCGEGSGEEGAGGGSRKRQLAIHAFAVNAGDEHHRDECSPKKKPHMIASASAATPAKPAATTATTVRRVESAEQHASFQPCPVCGRKINVENAIAVDLHVDACLRQHGGGGSRSSTSTTSSSSSFRAKRSSGSSGASSGGGIRRFFQS